MTGPLAPPPRRHHRTTFRKLPALVAALALGGCSAQHVTADRAELANIWSFNEVPKSSPRQLVSAFNRFCVEQGALSKTERDKALRAAGYVPLQTPRAGRPSAYVVDDKRPAIAVSERMCVARAASRTGQTDRFETYIAERFKSARALDPAAFGSRIEKAWEIPGNPPRVIATERSAQLGWYTYSLIHFQAGGG